MGGGDIAVDARGRKTIYKKERSDVTPTMTAAAGQQSAGVWGAVRANKAVVASVIALFTFAGVAAGVVRQPKYSATAKMAVLHLNFGSPGALNGYQAAAGVLSDTYARAITANGVIQPLAREFHTFAGTIAGELTAAAIPQSPVFMVTAKTPSKSGSIALANAAMAQLLAYLRSVNLANPDASRLYADLQKQEAKLSAAESNEGAIKASINGSKGGGSPSQQAQLAAAEAAVSTDNDEVSGLRNAYQQSLLATSLSQYVQPLSSAESATSDRSSRLGLFAFVGLALGIAAATGIAVWGQSRRPRRQPA